MEKIWIAKQPLVFYVLLIYISEFWRMGNVPFLGTMCLDPFWYLLQTSWFCLKKLEGTLFTFPWTPLQSVVYKITWAPLSMKRWRSYWRVCRFMLLHNMLLWETFSWILIVFIKAGNNLFLTMFDSKFVFTSSFVMVMWSRFQYVYTICFFLTLLIVLLCFSIVAWSTRQ